MVLIHPRDPGTRLYELADLTGDPPHPALARITGWARDYLCNPHPDLGRTGDVCPFTGPSMDRGLFYLALYEGVPGDPMETVDVLRGYRDWFGELEPTTGPLAQFKVILVLFPDVPTADAPQIIDAAQHLMKPEYVEHGLMIGEFHAGPPVSAGLWNPDFRPLRSPVPLLAIRHMVPTDFPFLRDEKTYVSAYVNRFGRKVPRHLREKVAAVAGEFGLDVPFTETERRRVRRPEPAPSTPQPADALADLTTAEKRVLLADLLRRRDLPTHEFPLTPAQERLWFLDRLDPRSAAYNMPGLVAFEPGVDIAVLERALGMVVARHEALRCGFREVDGTPVQVVTSAVDARPRVRLSELDLRPVEPGRRDDRVREVVARTMTEPFDLGTPPLLRGTVVRHPDDGDVLVLCVHHIVCDDVSIDLVREEIRQWYDDLRANSEPVLADVVQFPDYAAHLAARQAAGELEPQRAYWTGRLAGAPDLQAVPTDHPRPAEQSFRGASQPFAVPPELTAEIDALATRTRTTRFMVLVAAVQILLSRYSGGDDVVLGAPVAGRGLPELESCVGMFVNTVALRTDLSGDPTVEEALARVRDVVLGALAHQEFPFEQVIEAIGARRDLAHNPVFQTMLVCNPVNPGAREVEAESLLHRSSIPIPTSARFDLTVVVMDHPDGLSGWLDYSTDLFERVTMVRLAEHLVRVLGALCEGGLRVSEIDLLEGESAIFPGGRPPEHGGAERRLLASYNETDRGLGSDQPAHELVVARAAADPEAVAVVSDEEVLTYGELVARGRALARTLVSAGVRPSDVVGLGVPTGTVSIVGVLGILLAGAAYLPLDPTHPRARVSGLVSDAGAVAIVASDTEVFGGMGVRVVSPISAADTGPIAVPVAPESPAYVIYTSGSTGRPKGVVVPHRALTNLALAFADLHGFGPDDRILMVPPLTFDASVGDVFPALVSGAALVLTAEPAALSLASLTELVERTGITAVDTASPLWQQWVADLETAPRPDLRLMMVGGEPVPAETFATWSRRTSIPLYNHYGPTEATVCATSFRAETVADATGVAALPIGRPLPNVSAYVLDERGNPVPHGLSGELHIGGRGMALGYRGAPGQTAARFVPDPFGVPGSRMYRTGDLVRWRYDGRLEFLGRTDTMVKVRGYRIEPAEIEAACTAHPDVDAAVVEALDVHRLVGYYTGSCDAEELRAFLADRVPGYLVPDTLIRLDGLPRTSGGKVDRRALRESAVDERRVAYRTPGTPTEHLLAAIWSDLLEVDGTEVGADDNFFALGGHSLLAPRVLARIRTECGVDLPLRAVFESTDLAALATTVDRVARGESPDDKPDVDLRSEARLPADLADLVTRIAGVEYDPAVPRNPLLTGATGMVGGFLLRELLDSTEVETVHCLVRADSAERAYDRIRQNLEQYGLWHPSDSERIVPVRGSLGDPRFGLSDESYRALARTVDSVFHAGARVDFVRSYGALRPDNVDGTLEVLRLALEHRIKPLHVVSTLAVFLSPAYDGATVRETDPPDDPDGLLGGYDRTKWVADRLLMEARDAGMPVSLYRPARIGGSSRTGAAPDADFLARLIKGIVELGAAPRISRWTIDITPVDVFAAAIAGLAGRVDGTGTFHFFNPATLPFADLVTAIRRAGFPVEEIPPDEWERRLLEMSAESGSPLGPVAETLAAGQRAAPAFDCAATTRAVETLGVRCPPADIALVTRYLEHYVRTGFLPAPTREGDSA